MDNQDGAASRPSITSSACGWGCFCDRCWFGANTGEAQQIGALGSEQLEYEQRVHQVLLELADAAFGDDALDARSAVVDERCPGDAERPSERRPQPL